MIRSNAAQPERSKARCDQPGVLAAAISTRDRKPVLQDVRDIGLHSARRQEQPVRDLRIRQALTDQVDNCRLGEREAGPTAARPPPRWGPPARNPMECSLRRARSESEVTPSRSYLSRATRRARLARWLSPCSAASSAASSCAHAAPKASPAAANRSAARVTAATFCCQPGRVRDRRWPRAGALVEPHHGGPLAERAR